VLDGRAVLADINDLDGLLAAAESARRPAPAPPPWTWHDAAEATWNVYEEALAAPPARGRGARVRRPASGG
jgi:hypothetical protein